MTFEQAKNLRSDLLYMIGSENAKLKILDVVVAPVNDVDFDAWVYRYARNKENDSAIDPFIHSDVIVEFIFSYDGKTVDNSGMLIHGNVISKAKDFGVEIDIEKY